MLNGNTTLTKRIIERLKNPLSILTIITIIMASFLSVVQIGIGVNYFDVFNYLNVALFYAGIIDGGSNMLSIPPLIPFLTSLFFRVGLVSGSVIIILDAVIFVFGVMGLYLLFNERFDENQSFAGCLIYISLPLIISWAASGSLDVPAISFSIWAVYFMVVGVKKHSKYLYLAIPMFVLAVLTRYTAALLILPLMLYLFMSSDLKRGMKTHLTHLIIALGMVTPFLIYIYLKINYLSYLVLLVTEPVVTGKAFGVGDAAYNPNNLYYLYNMFNYIGVGPLKGSYFQIFSPSQGSPSILSYITVALVLCGLGIYVYRIISWKIRENDELDKFKIIEGIVLLFLLVASVISFFYAPYLITDVIVFFVCLLIYKVFRGSGIGNLKLDLLFLYWFFTFFIMHSAVPLKLDRYFITTTPALAYFIILGLSVLIEKYKPLIKNENLKKWGLYSIVGLIFLVSSTATFIGHTPNNCLINYIEPTTQWLEEYDPNYEDKVIYSDYSPAVTWSMKKMVITGVMRDYKDTDDFTSMLINSNAEYYIDVFSEPKPTLKGYREIKKTDLITIYQRI